MFATVLCTVNLKSCCNRKSRQQNLMQVGRRFLFCKCWGHWHCHYLQIPCNLFSRLSACVADTFWSVHIKFCFHQKKAQSKRPTTRIRPAERQHKGRAQKTWQAKHHVYTTLPSNTKFQTDQSGIQRQTVYRLNQIKFDLEKQRAKNEGKKQTELKKT